MCSCAKSLGGQCSQGVKVKGLHLVLDHSLWVTLASHILERLECLLATQFIIVFSPQ